MTPQPRTADLDALLDPENARAVHGVWQSQGDDGDSTLWLQDRDYCSLVVTHREVAALVNLAIEAEAAPPLRAALDVPPEAMFGLLAPDLEEKVSEEAREQALYEMRDAILPGLRKDDQEFVRRKTAWLVTAPERGRRNEALLERHRAALAPEREAE